MKWLTKVEYIKDFQLKLVFNDGQTFTIDFKGELNGEVFTSLQDVTNFTKFFIHPDFEVLSWPNGADFSSDYLYELGKKQTKNSA